MSRSPSSTWCEAGYDASVERPRIAVTVTNPERAVDRSLAELKNRRYLEAIYRAGGEPLAIDDRTPAGERAARLAAMDGLLITGGADIDPTRYQSASEGARDPDPGRDALDADAFEAAHQRSVPVLGVCRGLQAINVFSGGSLQQHVDAHESPAYPGPQAEQHPIQVVGGTRLASIVGGAEALVVNTYHHQAVTADRLAPSLIASASAPHPAGHLIEALESRDPEHWLVGVQCHPERTESSPPVMERLWAAFVAAARDHRSRAAVERG
jgi:putative glutamine amidotransferase